MPVTVVVLTFNEERNLPACLASVAGWTRALHVVDSGSTDQTRVIARQFGARVTEHSFASHAAQWRWALETLSIETDWVLGLDADQRLTPELRDEIIRLFSTDVERLAHVVGFYVNRRQIFRGRWIRHGAYYPKYLLKLFRRDRVSLHSADLLDHHFYLDGPAAKLEHDLIEDNRNEQDLAFWVAKHRRYAVLLAEEELIRRRNGAPAGITGRFRGTPDEHAAWLKDLWLRLPLYLRSVAYFGYRYVVRLGFLDGREGLTFHLLHGLWFRLLVDRHVHRLLRASRRRPERIRHVGPGRS